MIKSSGKHEKQFKQKGTSLKAYQRGVMLLEGVATHFGLPVTEKTKGVWMSVLVGIKRADHRFDNAKNVNDCKNKVNQTIAYLKGEAKIPDPTDSDIKFRKTMVNLKHEIDKSTPGGRAQFLDNFAEVCRVTQKVKTAQNAKDYSQFTRMEGKPTAKLLVSLLPDEFKDSPLYFRFERLLINITTLINNMDSVVDLPADKSEGQAQVKGPSLWIQANLIASVWRELFYVIPKVLSHKRARVEILRVIKEGIGASRPV